VETHLAHIMRKIREEVAAQAEIYGDGFDERNTSNDWVSYICRYACRAANVRTTAEDQRGALIKVAALCVSAMLVLERNEGFAPKHYD